MRMMHANGYRAKVLKALIKSREKPTRTELIASSIILFWVKANSFTPLPGNPPEIGKGRKFFHISATILKTNLPKRRCKQLKIVMGRAWRIDRGVGILDNKIVFAFIMLLLKPTSATFLKIHTKSITQTFGKQRDSSLDQPHGPTALAGGSFAMIFIYLSMSSQGKSICGMTGKLHECKMS